MSAPIAKSQFAFDLPQLSYVDIHLDEPEPKVIPEHHGIRALIAGFRAWREKRAALAEMEMMSDHELADIGLSRADLPRVFNDNYNQDLRERDVA